jgi:glutathione S-transferase
MSAAAPNTPEGGHPMSNKPRLVSHHLCPYVQRAVIVASEKGIALERVYISLDAKPDWFVALSPTGKVPLLQIGDTALFESGAICEYLDEAYPDRLHPEDPLERARHRAWMEFASAILGDIAGLYAAPDADAFASKRPDSACRFVSLEAQVEGPWFAGDRFRMVDAFYGSVFRYFDVIEPLVDLEIVGPTPRVAAWRRRLAARPSIQAAVAPDYAARLEAFLLAKNAHLSRLISARAEAA